MKDDPRNEEDLKNEDHLNIKTTSKIRTSQKRRGFKRKRWHKYKFGPPSIRKKKINHHRGRAHTKSVSSQELPICSIRRSIRCGISRAEILVIWKSHSSTGPRLEGAGPPWQNLYSQPCKVLFNIKHSYHFHKMHEKV